ncbi:MAG: hypothetical protein ACXWC9_10685, partial [Pseudobdellovibrionaceae bacterium]
MEISSLLLGSLLGAVLAGSLVFVYFRSRLFTLQEQLIKAGQELHNTQLQVASLDAQKKDFQSLSQQMTEKFEN